MTRLVPGLVTRLVAVALDVVFIGVECRLVTRLMTRLMPGLVTWLVTMALDVVVLLVGFLDHDVTDDLVFPW